MNKELRDKVNRWFERNWNHYLNEVRTNITKGIMSDYTDDICAFMYMEFMKQSPEKIEQMIDDGKVLNWMLRSTSFQIKSKTSPFYSRYRKKRANMVPTYFAESSYNQHDAVELDDYFQCMMECLSEESDLLDWYEKKLIDMKYLKQMTYNQIVETYGFSLVSTKKHLNKALDKIEQYCNQKLEE